MSRLEWLELFDPHLEDELRVYKDDLESISSVHGLHFYADHTLGGAV